MFALSEWKVAGGIGAFPSGDEFRSEPEWPSSRKGSENWILTVRCDTIWQQVKPVAFSLSGIVYGVLTLLAGEEGISFRGMPQREPCAAVWQ
jgi:hypothetical protein